MVIVTKATKEGKASVTCLNGMIGSFIRSFVFIQINNIAVSTELYAFHVVKIEIF